MSKKDIQFEIRNKIRACRKAFPQVAHLINSIRDCRAFCPDFLDKLNRDEQKEINSGPLVSTLNPMHIYGVYHRAHLFQTNSMDN